MNAPLNFPADLERELAFPPDRSDNAEWAAILRDRPQGEWTERAYLDLDTNHLVELSDGCLEFLPMPAFRHQFLTVFLWNLLNEFAQPRRLGFAAMAPIPVRLWAKKFREPDVLFLLAGRVIDVDEPPDGIDLAMEIVSAGSGNRKHDFVTKRAEYAKAGIPEYWIIDPEKNEVHVLVLDNGSYREHGIFKPGDTATSVLLPEFAVDVTALFQAGETAA